MIKNFLLALSLLLAPFAAANAQAPVCPSSPGNQCPAFVNSNPPQVLTAAQWNTWFASKQAALNYVPLNVAGGTMTGELITTPSSTGSAGFNLPHGTAPNSPANGDVWTTTLGMFARINGSTVGPFVSSTSAPVTSVFGRTGAVVAATNDYSVSQVTGAAPLASPTFTGTVTLPTTSVSGASFGLSGNISAPAWTTNGIRYKNVAATLTDTTSSGTVATAYTDLFGGNTIAASSATTFTNYFGSYFKAPTNGTNVTFTNKWALGADSLNVSGAVQLSGLTTGTCADMVILTSANALALSSTCPGSATSITVGTTTIGSGSTGNFEYNNAGTLGERTPTQVAAAITGLGAAAYHDQVFAASGTFTVPAAAVSTTCFKFTLDGPGGGGGGGDASHAGGGGGGRGGRAIKVLCNLTAGGTIAVTVGTGGTGGGASTGGNAGSAATTITSGTITISTVSAGAGSGGSAGASTQPWVGGGGGTSSGGDININGQGGGISNFISAGNGIGGQGGGEGGGVGGTAAGSGNGTNGTVGGGGGGGGSVASTSNGTGGTGGNGQVLVEWVL